MKKIYTFLAAIDSYIAAITPFTTIIQKTLLIISFSLVALPFTPVFEKVFGDVGNIALYALLVSVLAGPLYTLVKSNTTKLLLDIRPQMGVLMGMAAVVHGVPGLIGSIQYNNFPLPIVFGVFALFLTIPLLITSNKLSMRVLGAIWFKIHKAVYAVVILGVLHGSFVKGGMRTENIIQAVTLFGLYFGIKYAAIRKQKSEAKPVAKAS